MIPMGGWRGFCVVNFNKKYEEDKCSDCWIVKMSYSSYAGNGGSMFFQVNKKIDFPQFSGNFSTGIKYNTKNDVLFPDELWNNILSFINLRELYGRVSLVSKKFCSIIHSEDFRKNILHSIYFKSRIFNRFKFLKCYEKKKARRKKDYIYVEHENQSKCLKELVGSMNDIRTQYLLFEYLTKKIPVRYFHLNKEKVRNDREIHIIQHKEFVFVVCDNNNMRYGIPHDNLKKAFNNLKEIVFVNFVE